MIVSNVYFAFLSFHIHILIKRHNIALDELFYSRGYIIPPQYRSFNSVNISLGK